MSVFGYAEDPLMDLAIGMSLEEEERRTRSSSAGKKQWATASSLKGDVERGASSEPDVLRPHALVHGSDPLSDANRLAERIADSLETAARKSPEFRRAVYGSDSPFVQDLALTEEGRRILTNSGRTFLRAGDWAVAIPMLVAGRDDEQLLYWLEATFKDASTVAARIILRGATPEENAAAQEEQDERFERADKVRRIMYHHACWTYERFIRFGTTDRFDLRGLELHRNACEQKFGPFDGLLDNPLP